MGQLRFDKCSIIKSSREFDRIFTAGEKNSSEHILILFLESEETRIGFTVSKKIRGAVKRNRAKRRLKEIVRLKKHKLPEKRAYIFFAKPGFEKFDFVKLQAELLSIIAKIRQQRTS